MSQKELTAMWQLAQAKERLRKAQEELLLVNTELDKWAMGNEHITHMLKQIRAKVDEKRQEGFIK
jgi:hypothetical protein